MEAVLEVLGEEPGVKEPCPSPTPPPPTPYRRVGRRSLRGGRGIARPRSSPQTSLAIDVGVGSGALVVALARELPGLTWVGVDISAAALAVARENARRHEVAARIAFLRGDLLSAI